MSSISSSESFAVIGGEGFLGAALVSALIDKHSSSNVASFGLTQRRFSPSEYRFFRTDITSFSSLLDSLKQSGATTVFHTASPHANATSDVWEKVNIEGTKLVIQACREAGVKKLVFTSSMTVVYEEGVALKNVDERSPIIDTEGAPTYAGTKVRHSSFFPRPRTRTKPPLLQAEAEKMVLEANGKDGLLTCSLRLAGIVGFVVSRSFCFFHHVNLPFPL
jgi:sterol-4alpha-carboxylate 3-dehydrogenase (decarboxylating)